MVGLGCRFDVRSSALPAGLRRLLTWGESFLSVCGRAPFVEFMTGAGGGRCVDVVDVEHWAAGAHSIVA